MALVTTILIVDDTDSARTLLRNTLEESDLDLVIMEAVDGAEGLQMALEHNVDMMISDIVMPNLDGLAMLRSLRRQRSPELLPVILVTSQDDLDKRQLSYGIGANDYLTKPFSPLELVSRVEVQMRIKALENDLKQANERQQEQRTQDELTGLANRRHFYSIAQRELARSIRHKLQLAMVVLDIANFRETSRRIGHLIADDLIVDMAELLVHDARSPDTIGRFSGGRFIALLPQTTVQEARGVCERWRSIIVARAFPGHKTGELNVRFGAAHFPGDNIQNIDDLFSAAENDLIIGGPEGS